MASAAQGLATLRARLRAATLRPEADASGEALADLSAVHAALARASARAARWVEIARADKRSRPLVDRMLEQFPLDSAQGKALMSLAEALLRTPDPKRADQLIAERLAAVRAAGVPGDTDLLLRTGFTLLGAAGRLLPDVVGELSGEFSATHLTRPLVAPVVRAALRQSMQLLGHAFIVGETIDAALAHSRSDPELALCSFDVLGEGARTEADAQRYCDAYAHAIEALGRQAPGSDARALRDLGEALGARAALYAAAGAHGCMNGSRRACWRWRAAPRAPASASRSTPKRPTAWISRSTSSKHWRAMRAPASGTGSGLRFRPTAAAHRWCSSGSRSSRARAGAA